jgi:acetylornithine/N-succinyldiaminopimelate aminotransferase
MNLKELQAAEKTLLLSTYERNPLLLVSGKGVYLHAEDGTAYLDLLSGIGVNALGYGHPVIEQALRDGSTELLHMSNLYFHPGQAELALRLTRASGLNRAFFCNSGTEAWEAALKLARVYAKNKRDTAEPSRASMSYAAKNEPGTYIGTRFLAVEGAFHGRTIGSVATTHKDKYREPFAPVMPGVDFIPLNDVEALKAAWSTEYCAILLETIQGEGGIRPLTREFLDAARALTRTTGALLVLDEIQAGFGRTGKWFAYQHYDAQPDIVTIAKPMAGGLPMGAVLCTEEVATAMHAGMHGTTFGGGPLACRMAIAIFDEFERTGMLEHVMEVGDYFQLRLDELRLKYSDSVADVRGTGLMLAIELRDADEAKQALATMMETHHILLNRTSDTVLRFLPPYILEKAHVDITIAALDATLAGLEEQKLTAAPVGGTHA